MTPQEFDNLAGDIGRALDALPPLQAPRTLLPRVLAEAQAQGQTSPAGRFGFVWSPMAQVALVSVCLAVLTVGYWLWPFAGYATAFLPEPVHEAGRRADAVASMVDALLHVGGLVWQAVVGPIVKGLFTLTLMLCAACALFAAALGRLALGGAHQS